MNVETRKTAAGTEYWDAKEKRTRFVPTGGEPDFEVTENPKSMIISVDLAKSEDKTVTVKQKKTDEKVVSTKVIIDDVEIDLDIMNSEQLRSFAEQNNITIPGNMSKEETIRNHIAEELASVTE